MLPPRAHVSTSPSSGGGAPLPPGKLAMGMKGSSSCCTTVRREPAAASEACSSAI